MSKKKHSNKTLLQTITIPEGSLVLMCAAPNSGKTHFSKKHFSNCTNTVLICVDELFYSNAAKASIFETYDSLMHRSTKTVFDTIKEAAKASKTVVLDAVSHFTHERLDFLEDLRPLFKNIVLIVIDLDIPDLLKHGVKQQSPLMKRFDMCAPNTEETRMIAVYVKTLFINGEIYKGVDTVHRITSKTLNSCKVIIE